MRFDALLVRREDADEIERIGGGHDDQFLLRSCVAQLPQQSHRVAQRELFSRDAGDKSPSANFSPRFEPPQDLQRTYSWTAPDEAPDELGTITERMNIMNDYHCRSRQRIHLES